MRVTELCLKLCLCMLQLQHNLPTTGTLRITVLTVKLTHGISTVHNITMATTL
jgi:hypothetical protein